MLTMKSIVFWDMTSCTNFQLRTSEDSIVVSYLVRIPRAEAYQWIRKVE
jgi:hypothetical protein